MKNHILQNGTLGALVVVLYFSLLYAIGRSAFLNVGLQWAAMAFYVLFMYRAARTDDEQRGAEREFRHQVRAPFAVFILINLAYWLFYYGLHLADPELVRQELLLQKQRIEAELARGAGDPQWAAQLRQHLQEIAKALENPVQPLGPVLMRFGVGAIGGFALASLIVLVRRAFR
ncbi:MAG: hypothetical protein NZM43_00210 [Saprospiraceae bacterium]|nr:hypothetical protein [Saprospiraceae bacterium]MDW8482723.1 hypothetical protein [Saprospiraceae bacterium]